MTSDENYIRKFSDDLAELRNYVEATARQEN
jgi:hypothetical protein